MSDVEASVVAPRRRASPSRKRRHGPPARPPTQLDLHLGERLRLLRIARGVSLEEMASLLGLTVRDVHEHERGIKRIPASRLVEYAETLEVRLSRFFADTAPQAPL
jgi:hypothetical protein